MASYRRPKGAINRHIADWNNGRLYYSSIQNGFSTSTTQKYGLQNVSSTGSSLIVWDCTIEIGRFTAAVNPLGIASWEVAKVPIVGTLNVLQPIDPQSPTTNSGIGNNIDDSSLVSGRTQYNALSDAGIWRWNGGIPMAIIRPGYTLLAEYVITNAFACLSVVVELADFP